MLQFCIFFYANYTTLATQKGRDMAQWPSPKNALGFGILQTAKNRSFECIMMQNGNHLLVGDMALSRWESFIATTKFKQRKR